MAQHLRIGSVVDVYTTSSGSVSAAGATVTNVTDSYVEYETDSVPPVSMVRPWSFISRIDVVTD